MATFYGDETVYSYESQGGIALMSNDIEHGTVSGSGNDYEGGEDVIPTRISWTITYDGTSYTGGITNICFFTEVITFEIGTQTVTVHGPFYGHTPAELYATASREGNLNEVFSDWNNNYSTEVHGFVTYLKYYTDAGSCVHEGSVIG